MRKCSRCKIPKPNTDFCKGHHYCKLCLKSYRASRKEEIAKTRKRHYDKNRDGILKKFGTRSKEYIRNNQLKSRFGITLAQYNDMRRNQNERCAICEQLFSLDKRGPRVDHDHKTKKIRLLLCHKCNIGLGHFNDDINLLRKAMLYIESFQTVIL